jgi:hypothetical protein
MLRIDNSLLQEIGLGALPDAEKNSLLKHIYETLEMRVGIRLADQMSNEQLDEFERYFEAKDDEGAFKWLESNFPNYKDIVQEEFDKLKAEVTQSAPQILASSQAAPQAAVDPQQVQQQPQQPQTSPQYVEQQASPQQDYSQPIAPPQNTQTQMPPSQTEQMPAYDQQPAQPQQQPMPSPYNNPMQQQPPYPDQQPPAGSQPNSF